MPASPVSGVSRRNVDASIRCPRPTRSSAVVRVTTRARPLGPQEAKHLGNGNLTAWTIVVTQYSVSDNCHRSTLQEMVAGAWGLLNRRRELFGDKERSHTLEAEFRNASSICPKSFSGKETGVASRATAKVQELDPCSQDGIGWKGCHGEPDHRLTRVTRSVSSLAMKPTAHALAQSAMVIVFMRAQPDLPAGHPTRGPDPQSGAGPLGGLALKANSEARCQAEGSPLSAGCEGCDGTICPPEGRPE